MEVLYKCQAQNVSMDLYIYLISINEIDFQSPPSPSPLKFFCLTALFIYGDDYVVFVLVQGSGSFI